MLTQPPCEFMSFGVSGPQLIPLPPGGWSWISTFAQAQEVLKTVMVFCPDATLQDASPFVGNGGMSLIFPNPNPNGYAMWTVRGSFQTPSGVTLNLNAMAGGTFDEGPAQVITLPNGVKAGPFGGQPSIWDDHNPDTSIGGTFLDYGDMEDVGGPDAYVHWANVAQDPVKAKPVLMRLTRVGGLADKSLLWMPARSSGVLNLKRAA